LAELKLLKTVLRSSPHAQSVESVSKVMWTVVLALLPALIAALWFFGLKALLVLVVCTAGCLIFEYAGLRMRMDHAKAMRFVFDGSAVVTGVLLALNLPASSPWWLALVGALVAMMLGKHLFGGLGQNIFNPALVARVFLLLSFPAQMTAWTMPGGFANVDAVTTATPLGMIKADGLAAFQQWAMEHGGTLWNMFIGNMAGSLGETSVLALLIGGLFLIAKGYVRWQIPVSYIATVFVFTGIMWLVNPHYYPNPAMQICSAGLFLGAFFMATDMVTSPVTAKGMLIFGFGCGLITALIRLFGAFPEGVSFAILIMNGLAPMIDRYTKPVTFGTEKLVKEAANA
jgi:Na+-translocating ferredoxin:NAD+ oxidoreductase subunit D